MLTQEHSPFLDLSPGSTRLCDHAGVLLFAPELMALGHLLPEPAPLLPQWFASLLQGAINIEQTKYLNASDLDLLLGHVTRTLGLQRQELRSLGASQDNVSALLRWNFAQLDAAQKASNDFYLDPHTQHYTGAQNVLKGWCAAIRWADKLINSDYVHTAQGTPIYFECTDNYEDLRVRLFPLVERLRETLQWQAQRTLSFVIDRGIYGNEVFKRIASDEHLHLITWEKGYEPGAWDASAVSGRCSMDKSINSAQNTRRYEFEWKEQRWTKNTQLRQIEVQATNPNGQVAQVSILTDDLERETQAVVLMMFRRWVQENDFKYLNKHFGINQITSYKSLSYGQIEGLVDRQVPNAQWQQKHREGQALQKKKRLQLQAADEAQRKEQQRQQRQQQIEQELAQATQSKAEPSATNAQADHARAALSKEQRSLKQASKRHEQHREKRAQRIEELHRALEANEASKEQIAKTVSRIDSLIEGQKVRMDNRSKTLMDTLRITARNAFYRSLSGFKAAYDNFRDDHDHWRELTRSSGIVHASETVVEVHLIPRVNYQPKLAELIRRELGKWNQRNAEQRDGRGRRIELHLAQRDEIEIRLRRPPEEKPAA